MTHRSGWKPLAESVTSTFIGDSIFSVTECCSVGWGYCGKTTGLNLNGPVRAGYNRKTWGARTRRSSRPIPSKRPKTAEPDPDIAA